MYKKRPPILHRTGTKEIFLCLAGAPTWCKILADTYTDKPYKEFLDWLIEKNFFDRSSRILINKIVNEFKKPSAIVTNG